MVRFLHTADWQLGKQFDHLGPEAAILLRTQRVETVRRLAELAEQRQVDAVLVAGDCFESALVSPETITGAIQALRAFRGDWVLLPGNHDAGGPGSIWEERVRPLLADSPRIQLALTGEPLLLAEGRLAVLPAPLLRRHEAEDLTAGWEHMRTPPEACRVGLAHGSVAGYLPPSAEGHNPIAGDRARSASLDYLALGDWHGTVKINAHTYYSGTPEPDSFKENDKGNVLLAELDAPGAVPRVEIVSAGHYGWTEMAPDLHTRGDIEALEHQLDALTPAHQQVVRLQLGGTLAPDVDGYLQERLLWWRGKFKVTEIERTGLRIVIGDGDFAPLQPPGFVADAIGRLRAKAESGDARAGDALAELYRLCAPGARA